MVGRINFTDDNGEKRRMANSPLARNNVHTGSLQPAVDKIELPMKWLPSLYNTRLELREHYGSGSSGRATAWVYGSSFNITAPLGVGSLLTNIMAMCVHCQYGRCRGNQAHYGV